MRNCFYNPRPSKSARLFSPSSHSCPNHLPTLFYHISNRNWNSTIRRCKTHAHEATMMDQWGNTALHLACRLGGSTNAGNATGAAIRNNSVVPLNVIQTLLQISSPNVQNVDGCTPLHIACSHRSSADIISALLDASRCEFAMSTPTSSTANEKPKQLRKWSYEEELRGKEVELSTIEVHSIHHSKNHQSTHNNNKALQSGTLILTNSGKTPLHYACGSFRHLSMDAFRILLEATYKDSKKANMDILSQKDNNDDTPLTLLQKRYSERIRHAIQLVKRRDANHVGNEDGGGGGGGADADADTDTDAHRGVGFDGIQQDMIDDETTNHDATMIEETLDEFWEKASLILQISYHGAKYSNTTKMDNLFFDHDSQHNYQDKMNQFKKQLRWRIVHASIGIGSKCPKPVVMLALSTYPEQVRECDESGNFPLHLAAMCDRTCSTDKINDQINRVNTFNPTARVREDLGQQQPISELEADCADFNLIETLIKIFPKAARLPNADGHLPFALALNCGNWMWNDDLKTLLHAFPSAIECQNLKDVYFPHILFLVGGCGKNEVRDEHGPVENDDYHQSCSLFYTLLRERPFIVNYCTSSSNQSIPSL